MYRRKKVNQYQMICQHILFIMKNFDNALLISLIPTFYA